MQIIKMTEKEVIDAIKYMQEYQTETDKIEAKTAEKEKLTRKTSGLIN